MSSISSPTVFLIRHARTALNDPANERVRAYSDIPISFEGKQGLEKTAEFLKKEGYPVTRILSSPLQRTIMTAEIIAQAVGARVFPNHGLLPWNLGNLSGEPIKNAAAQMEYYQNNPDIKVPGGESYKDFYARWNWEFEKMLVYAETHPTEVLSGVVHSRNLLALPSILGSKDIGEVPVKGGPGPESVTKVTLSDDDWKMEVIWDISQ